jgi:hypothetical protein
MSRMQLFQPLPSSPSSLPDARAHLSAATAIAGKVNFDNALAPTEARVQLAEGVRLAKLAAADLLLAEPESDYQDLVLARQQVLQGAALLEQAAWATGSAQGVDPMPHVRDLARQAFEIFDSTEEILYNN